jgi:hypothetical protein
MFRTIEDVDATSEKGLFVARFDAGRSGPGRMYPVKGAN